jgi:hypothetical protein
LLIDTSMSPFSRPCKCLAKGHVGAGTQFTKIATFCSRWPCPRDTRVAITSYLDRKASALSDVNNESGEVSFPAGSRRCLMREYAGARKRSAAMIAQMSAQRLREQLERERDPGKQQRLSRRIVELTKIAPALDVPAAP